MNENNNRKTGKEMDQNGINLFTFLKLYKPTFKDYESNYFNELDFFLSEYEDNTELLFIKLQKSKVETKLSYTAEFVKNLTENDFNQNEILDLFQAQIATSDKIKSFLEQRKKEIETNFEVEPQTNPAPENEQNKMYFKVGLLFAQKKIFSKITTVNGFKTTKYHYENEVFDNPTQLSKRLKLTRQFINDSFTGANTNHNIFNNLKQLKNIVDYCNENTITIDIEFLDKYTTLVENKQ